MTDAMFTDHFFTNADGLRLHYRDYLAQGTERGVPVLCLHGLTRNVKDFEELAPMIAAKGRRVIVASQRGRGRSDPDPQTERYTPPVYAADMLALLDDLGIGRAVFVGTSMGGLMTMIAAGMQPRRLAAAVINDIGPSIAREGLDRIKLNTSSREPAADWQDAAARTRESNLAAFPGKADDEAFWLDFAKKTWIERDGQVVLDYDGNLLSMIDGGTPLPDIWDFWEPFSGIPTVVVRGGISDLLLPETVAEMKRRNPDLVVAEVPDVGHAPFMTEPEAWSAVSALLDRVD
ncbi:alpha/beta hydrolase [Maricaulis sp.]|uniref:alpha/beta fold hydrolase n=1 Tax=Maricaulis sp. TaxID=1486257 RepID=UPI00261E8A92|nr:alpha/beta hydrolase [Maricaulis sp.]